MANPFYVAPLGGLSAYANIGNQIGGAIEQSQLEQQQAEAEQKRTQVMQQFSEAMDRGNPQEIAQLSMQYPEIGQAAMGGIKFANETTKANLRDSMQRVVAGEDPIAVLQERIQMVEAQGGDASDSRRELETAMQDPEAYRQQIESIYAMSFPAEYTAFRKATGAASGPNIGQYNPRDYTTDSFAEFVRTGNPAVLERYAAQRSVDIGGVPHVFDPAIGGYRPAGVAGATGAQPVTAETVGQSEAEIAAQRERAVTQARGQAEAQTPEAQRKREEAVRQSQDTLNVVNQLLDSDLGAITGLASRTPTIRPESMDLVRTAERLEALLTSENLGIMTGVLTDRDVELIKSIGSGLRVTEGGIQMSEEGARDRLMQIRDTIQRKLAQQQSGAAPAPASNAGQGGDIEALINKYAD